MIGTRLAHYEITSHLGTGGMGEVYEARDSKLGRSVAIKLLPEAVSNDNNHIVRFEREARVLAALSHSNIAAIYGVEEAAGRRFLVMELVGGETLAERIRRGPMPIDDVLSIARQIADALEAAHEKGVIHRDLKPANIKITPDGSVKVLDFGLAKVREAETSDLSSSPTMLSTSLPGMIFGTASYMSPEQAKGKDGDRTGDIWAFGCVLGEMLTGKRVFEGETVSEILAGVLKTEPDWNRLPAGTPSSIRRLLRRCLQKEKKVRLHDIADARIEIDEASTEEETPSKPRLTLLWYAVTLPLLLVAVVLALRAWTAPAIPEDPTVRFEVAPPKGSFVSNITLSPDGSKLAFTAGVTSAKRIWVRPLDSDKAVPLEGSEKMDTQFFWSPDSNYIGFSAAGKLKKIAANGGPSQVLCDLPNVTSAFFGGTWNSEDTIVLAGPGSPLVKVRLADCHFTNLTQSPGPDGTYEDPNFLPDGRYFTYVANDLAYVGNIDSNFRKTLSGITSTVQYSPKGYLFFVRDRTLMSQRFDLQSLELRGEAFPIVEDFSPVPSRGDFSVSSNGSLAYLRNSGRSQLGWFDRKGNQIGPLSIVDDFHEAELSPDEKYVAFYRISPLDLWVLDLARGGVDRLTSGGNSVLARWSPDSKEVAFRKGVSNIYKHAFGAVKVDVALLQSDQGVNSPEDWSRDGQYLIYSSKGDLWALPLSTSSKPIAITETSFFEYNSRLSPDGHWVTYQSNETGRDEVYVQSFPQKGTKRQISTEGGQNPRWSRDGNELFYLGPDLTLMAASLETGVPSSLFATQDLGFRGGTFNVARDGRFLLALRDRAPAPTVILNWRPKQ